MVNASMQTFGMLYLYYLNLCSKLSSLEHIHIAPSQYHWVAIYRYSKTTPQKHATSTALLPPRHNFSCHWARVSIEASILSIVKPCVPNVAHSCLTCHYGLFVELTYCVLYPWRRFEETSRTQVEIFNYRRKNLTVGIKDWLWSYMSYDLVTVS